MSTSRNYITGLALAVAFLVATNVQADMEFVNNLSTADTTGWSVATLTPANYKNPTKSNNGNYATVGTKWGDFPVDWGKVEWADAYKGERDDWKDVDKGWIAGVNSGNTWDPASGYHNTNNNIANGFYAFQYSLYAVGNETAVNGILGLTLGSDDYVAAIYANGKEIYTSNGGIAVNATPSNKGWTTLENLGFSVDLIDSALDLTFIVHNTNLGGSNSNNAMGLYVNGTLTTDIKMTPSPTPEPATLAVLGLGLVGLGIARRRMKK